MKKRCSLWALPVCFLLIVGVLTVLFFALPKQSFAENEKRLLSEKPQFSFAALLDGSLTAQWQTYLADHFPLREAFVGLHAYFELAMGQNGDSGVYRGKDGYLFASQGKIDLAKEKSNIDAIRAFADRNNLQTTWMIVPCAGAALSEKLPRFHKAYRDGEMLDTLRANIGDDALIDTQTLFTENKDTQLYYKTDHHLTSAGSRLLYEAFCKQNGIPPHDFAKTKSTDDFYGTAYSKSGLWLTKPDALEVWEEDGGDYTVTITEGTNVTTSDSLYFPAHLGDKDQYPVFLDGNHALVKIQNNRCHNGKKLLILKDSFAHCMTTFLAAEYETIYMVDLRYHRSPVADLLQSEGIRDLLVVYGAENLATSTDIAWLTMLG
jgi:hypothetical protein